MGNEITKESPANAGRKQDGTFAPGASGNPKGKKRGTRHKATLAVQSLLEGEAETISRTAVELAKGGDLPAIKLVLERVLPPRKDAPVMLELPAINSTEDIVNAQSAILSAVTAGEITPMEGRDIAALLEQQRKAIETQELEQRITALERQHDK